MTEIALIADIHGNIPALMAVDKDIKDRGISTIYCLGDMCGRGPGGVGAIDYCRENCSLILAGNWDLDIANEVEKRRNHSENIGAERREFIKTLPLYHKMWLSGRRLHLFHGRPLTEGVIYGETETERKLALFSLIEDDVTPDIVGYADIHRQYKTDFRNSDKGRVLFNTGSVGNSYCTVTASYVIIRGSIDAVEQSSVSIEFVSVPYDNERAAEDARRAAAWFDHIDEYITEVTTGRWQSFG